VDLFYVIAALVVLSGGLLILQRRYDNKALHLLRFFVIACTFRHVNDSQLVWAVELFFILIISKIRPTIIRDNRWYWYFILFAIFSLFYSENPIRGISGIVMYSFPLFYYALTYLAIRKTTDVGYLFFSFTNSLWLVLLLCISYIFVDYVFVYYGMAICIVPVYLYFRTKKRKYIFLFLICLLPALLFVKRTPVLGIFASMMIFSMLMFKWKAIIPTILAVLLGMVVVLSIPSFREKVFYGNESIELRDIAESVDAVETVNMSGRHVFWNIALEKYFEKAPFWGAGQGTVKAYLQSDENEYKDSFSLMHNDWLLILCEQGLIGVSILIIFMIGVFRKCIEYSAKRYPKDLRLISAACAGSFASTIIHMFFENCMNTFVFSTSFVFYALFNFYLRRYKIRIN
jgi:O-antigen ligase